jgi:hypothetical protein
LAIFSTKTSFLPSRIVRNRPIFGDGFALESARNPAAAGKVGAAGPLRVGRVGTVVMGTDYPFPWTKTAVDHILTTPGLSDAERVAILGETAANLLAIKPA